MATSAYDTWVNKGKPYRLARPIQQLRDRAQDNGVRVLGTIGNDDHLTARTPEDHTPFSFTAWPVPLPGYVVTAIDLENTGGLGQRIRDMARRGELPWLKYVNYSRQQYSHWDNFEAPHSNPDEHVHMSIRSDWCDRSIETFDPFGTGGLAMEEIKGIQTALRDAGFDPGPIDGVWGPRTQGALTAALRAGGTQGPKGDKGDPGEPGAPGKTPTHVRITGEVSAYE